MFTGIGRKTSDHSAKHHEEGVDLRRGKSERIEGTKIPKNRSQQQLHTFPMILLEIQRQPGINGLSTSACRRLHCKRQISSACKRRRTPERNTKFCAKLEPSVRSNMIRHIDTSAKSQ